MDLVSLGGDKVGGDDRGIHFRAFGDDLEDAVGLFLGRECASQLIQAEKRQFGIEFDEAVDVLNQKNTNKGSIHG